MSMARRIVVIGAGAAGTFAAIHAAQHGAQVVVLEKGPRPLTKVAISGGGRCNVTHDCHDPRILVASYPRGGRELRGPFSRWHVPQTVAWFAEHGVPLKTESDGRMFPTTDSSQTVIDALLGAAEAAGVELRLRCGATSVRRDDDGFVVTLESGATVHGDRLLVASGGMRAGGGETLVRALGHAIIDPVPSLFTFRIDDPRLADLAGVSVPDAVVAVTGIKSLRQQGPVLVTHWGISGPGVLKLSAWGARELAMRDYLFEIAIDWAPDLHPDDLASAIAQARQEHPRKKVAGGPAIGVPRRLWERLTSAAGIAPDRIWTELTKVETRALATQIHDARFAVTGKSLNKDEFVTCGGVTLTEVDLRCMESKRVAGLYFAGEILDIDGITGGFNLQAAWTGGAIAGAAMANDG